MHASRRLILCALAGMAVMAGMAARWLLADEPATAVAVAAPATPPAETAAPVTPSPLDARLTDLTARLSGRLPQWQRGVANGTLRPPSASIEEVCTALAAVQVAKARDFLAGDTLGTGPQPGEADAALDSAARLLELRNPQTLPDLVRHDRLVELAYFAGNDGSPQPYFLYVPEACRDGRPQPLVVFLHGYVPNTSRTDPYLVSDGVLDLADEFKTIFVVPHGRTNTDFQFAGEVDVMQVIAEVAKFHPIDPDRIYLLGVSMGGAGVWQIATHYPDRFAAVAPINGQADWYRFWHEKFGYPARAELPRHIDYMIGINDPLDLVDNLSNLYSYSQHALRCFLGPVHTRDMVKRLREIEAPCETFEDPSELGHYIYWQIHCWRRAFEHLAGQVRQPHPRHVRYTTYTLRYPGAYWVAIEGIETWGKLASVEARCEDGGRLTVTSANVTALALTPPREWAGADGAFAIAWNGAEPRTLASAADGTLRLDARPAAAAGLRKTRQVCGPAADVLDFPFLIVRGTAGTAEETARNQQLASRFAEDWYAYGEGAARIVTESEVTDATLRDFNLILVGLPENNAVLARVSDKLPFRLSRERIALPDGKTFPTADTGLLLTYPNPLQPDRYVLVCNGVHWGEGAPRNHKFDRIPDFTLFTRDTDKAIGINRFLAAGVFDSNWRYDPKLTDFPAAPPIPAPQP